MTVNNNDAEDDFNFDDFLTDETKAAIEPEALEVNPPKDETVVASPQATEQVAKPEEKAEAAQAAPAEAAEPVRASDEPDWKYEHRREIWQKRQELIKAEDPSEKDSIKSEIDEIRKMLSERSRTEAPAVEKKPDASEPADIETIVSNAIKNDRIKTEFDHLENDFFSAHKEISSPKNREIFTTYVGYKYNLLGKTVPQVKAILESAYEELFPDMTDKIVDKSEKLAKKLDAVDFSGSSASAAEATDPVKDEGKRLVDEIRKNSGNDFSWAVE